MTTDHEMRMEALRLYEENERMRDLVRNIAGLDDNNLFISSHAVLVTAVKEWRNEARRLQPALDVGAGTMDHIARDIRAGIFPKKSEQS